MHNKLTILLFVLGLTACQRQEFDALTSTETLYSEVIKDDFKIRTYLPSDYNASEVYPVIFLLDGNWYFNKFTNEVHELVEAGELEASIIVGIGYEEKINEKRFRDYTFPQDARFDILNGEADNFSAFLKDELIPKIKAAYSIDDSQLILMGHSLGGLNTLFNMLQTDSPFSGYAAVSSSVWWNDGFLFGIEEAFAEKTTTLAAKAFIAVGGDEPPSMTILNEEMAERLKARNYEGLEVQSAFFSGASHSQVPMKGFIDGIKFILN